MSSDIALPSCLASPLTFPRLSVLICQMGSHCLAHLLHSESESSSRSVLSNYLRPHGLYSPWNSPGQNTGVGSLSFLQGIFPTQGSNPGLPHCRQILYQLSHKGSPRILEWVTYPFSSGSSQPRNQTGVSCIAGGFFTNSTIRESIYSIGHPQMLILYFLPLDPVPKPRQRS